MTNGIGANHAGGNPFVGGWRANVKADESKLSCKERRVLTQIRDKVGGPVKINLGQQSDCGQFTLKGIGFGGVSACGARPPFLVTAPMLKEMAGCEKAFRKFMVMIEGQLQKQAEMEASFGNVRQAAQENMTALDFWKSHPTEETQSKIFVNAAGERILALSGPFGVMYLKIGYATDLSSDDANSASDTDIGEIIEIATDV